MMEVLVYFNSGIKTRSFLNKPLQRIGFDRSGVLINLNRVVIIIEKLELPNLPWTFGMSVLTAPVPC